MFIPIKSRLNKFHIMVVIHLATVYALTFSYYYYDTRKSLIEAQQKNIQSLLLYNRALSSFIAEVQRPEVTRICPKNIFSPPLHSSSYITRRVIDYTNSERKNAGLQPLEFKWASRNPLNPLNKANTFEESILERLEKNQKISYNNLRTVNHKTYYYMVLPGKRVMHSCLACHASVQTAPNEMVTMYGANSGYGYKLGDLSSIISIQIDITDILKAHRHKMIIFAIFLAIVFIIAYLVIIWLVQKKQSLEEQAYRDPLTHLLNRSLYKSTYENEQLRCRRDKKYLAILIMDIDFFKQYNDSSGHQAGDSVIKQVADETARSFNRISDFVFRIGGEEFSVICSAFEAKQLEQMAQNLCKNIENLQIKHPVSEVKNSVTVSIGLGIIDSSSKASFDEIYKSSDEALYRAKNDGRNRVSSIML